MRRFVALVFLVAGLACLAAGYAAPARAQSDERFAALLTLDDTIQPVSSGFLRRGIDQAVEQGAQFIVVRLDTPGGLLDSTREMVSAILSSPIPVVVYVSPQGAHAASAGTFITAAAHVAAMAPTTNIGAASPVGSGGEDLPDTLKSKATEDAASLMRSIAAERGRNADALEATIFEATSYTASEALDEGIIDIVAANTDDLLAQLDGRTVELEGGETVTLDTSGIELREISQNAVEQFLGVVARPDIAFLLLTLGGILIVIEMLNPGVIVPGTFGAIALALGLLGVANLPVNWVGVGLIGLAMFLFFLELQSPGLGIFIVGGAISFILGAFLIFGDFGAPSLPSAPSFGVSLWLIAVIAALLLGIVFLLLRAVRQARRTPEYHLGGGSLVGKVGVAATDLNPRGSVQIASELWSAASDTGEKIVKGEEVIVLEMEGLTLKVFKASASPLDLPLSSRTDGGNGAVPPPSQTEEESESAPPSESKR